MTGEHNHELVIIRGQVRIAPTVQAFFGATVHVYLEETSVADAAAVRVASVQLTLFWHPGTGAEPAPTVLPFAIRLDKNRVTIRPSARYTLRVWVDADSDGNPGPADLFSDQAYPVLTRGFGTWAVITLV